MITIGAVIKTSNKNKQSKSSPFSQVKKFFSKSNNPLVTCKFFNKKMYGYANYKKVYKYKGYRSKDHNLASCPKAKKV